MKVLKLTLAFFALVSLSAFFSCNNGTSTPQAPKSPGEIISNGEIGRVWVIKDAFVTVGPQGTPVAIPASEYQGFEIEFKLNAGSKTTGTYKITKGNLSDDKLPVYANPSALTGTFSVSGVGSTANEITFGTGQVISAVTFGGVQPTDTALTLEWTVTTDKTRPKYRFNLVRK
jgi:uncharacterized lipoprotein NlpE involved in copper resistance